jgi:CRISPR-associated protein Cmr6
MRQALHNVGTPDHVGLAYDAWTPVEDNDGKVPDARRAQWLGDLERISIAPDYARSFKRWKTSFSAPGDRAFELTLASRLLVGHGNASAIDVGLTVHHTWGIPVIPGSALKGLVAHYVDATYGPTDASRKPWEQQGDERVRADYQGVTWNRRRIERGPGVIYRALFGAPDAREDSTMRQNGFQAGAAAGLVTLHDALYVPGSLADNRPFSADVLTVHQKDYYDSGGRSLPNDYDSPNPVAFLTVRPGARLLFALSGPPDWTELAEQLLRVAMEQWGVGGKTSAGYGRLIALDQAKPIALTTRASNSPKPGDRVEATLLKERTKKGGWKARHDDSGLEGPVQNSIEVPSDKVAGDQIRVEVRIAKGKESAFRYLSDADEQTPIGKKQ